MRGDGKSARLGMRCPILAFAASLVAATAILFTPFPVSAASTSAGRLAFTMVQPPAGFDNLLQPQRTVVDVYYGGQRVGEASVVYQPGAFRFDDVGALLALLPELVDQAAIRQSLADSDLDPHRALACAPNQSGNCGELRPPVAGIIFDQQRFRVDVFVAPEMLKVRSGLERGYLDAPAAGLTLVDSLGATVAGSDDGRTSYTIQNRTVIGDGTARLRSETSISSGIGFHVETLTAELDRPDLRYSAGLFSAPGMDLLGRRKMFGAGVGSQIDTRLDKYLLQGSPLILFLPRRARVDIVRDGRLLASRTYEAGSQNLDTSSLPDGSYDLTLRIQEAGAGVREERRFFIKNALVAPMGQTLFFAYAGVLAKESDQQPIGLSNIPYFQAGVAHRFTPHLALDASLVDVNGKIVGEIGGYLFTGIGQLRAAGMASSSGDMGLLLQANSLGRSAFGYAFDLRRVWSRSGAPIIPTNGWPSRSFNMVDSNPGEGATGSFTQINANLTYRLGQARLGVSGYYRRDRQDSSYAIGPTAYWPVLRRRGLELALEGHMTQSNQGRSGYLGFTLQLLRPRTSMSSSVGVRTASAGSSGTEAKPGTVAAIGGSWEHENILGGELSLAGALERTPDEDSARLSASSRGEYGSTFIDATRTLSGARKSTQYSASFQTGLAVTSKAALLGGKELGEGSIVVRVGGHATGTVFEVLVNDSPRGTLRAGSSLPLFLPPYRAYDVRIRPLDGDRASYDGRTRKVSIYPGTVASLEWKAEPVVAVFGRAVLADGSPIVFADITATSGVGQTDDQGYFQIETGTNEVLNVRTRDGRTCRLTIGNLKISNGYAPLGEQQCQASPSQQFAQRSTP